MFKKFLTLLLTAIMTVSLAACNASNSDTQKPSDSAAQTGGDSSVVVNDSNVESSAAESGTTEAVTPPLEGAVVKYKSFEIRRAENDYCMVWLRYRENSDYVAEVTFQMKVPTDFSEYTGILSDNDALASKISSQNIPTSLVEFSNAEMADGLETFIKFNKLDEGNPNIVALVEEYVDLPAQNGYLLLSECEQFLIDSGLTLKEQN